MTLLFFVQIRILSIAVSEAQTLRINGGSIFSIYPWQILGLFSQSARRYKLNSIVLNVWPRMDAKHMFPPKC